MWNHSLDIYSLLATEVFFVQFLYSFIIIAIISSKIHASFFFLSRSNIWTIQRFSWVICCRLAQLSVIDSYPCTAIIKKKNNVLVPGCKPLYLIAENGHFLIRVHGDCLKFRASLQWPLEELQVLMIIVCVCFIWARPWGLSHGPDWQMWAQFSL